MTLKDLQQKGRRKYRLTINIDPAVQVRIEKQRKRLAGSDQAFNVSAVCEKAIIDALDRLNNE